MTAGLAISLGVSRYLLRHQHIQNSTAHRAVDKVTPHRDDATHDLNAFHEALQDYRTLTFRTLRQASLSGLALYVAFLVPSNTPFFVAQRLGTGVPFDWSAGLEPEMAVACVSGSVGLVFAVAIAAAKSPASPTPGVQEVVNRSMWLSVLDGVAFLIAAFGLASALTQLADNFTRGLALVVFASFGLIVTSALRVRRDDVFLHASRELGIAHLRASIRRVRDQHPYTKSNSYRGQVLGWLSILGLPVILPTSVYAAMGLAASSLPFSTLMVSSSNWLVLLLLLTALTVPVIYMRWLEWARNGRAWVTNIALVVPALFGVSSLLLVISVVPSNARPASYALMATWIVVLAYQHVRGTSRSLLVSRTLATATHRNLLRDLRHARRAERPFFPPPQRSCSTSSIRGRADSSP